MEVEGYCLVEVLKEVKSVRVDFLCKLLSRTTRQGEVGVYFSDKINLSGSFYRICHFRKSELT